MNENFTPSRKVKEVTFSYTYINNHSHEARRLMLSEVQLMHFSKIGLGTSGAELGIVEYSKVTGGMWYDPVQRMWYRITFYRSQYTERQATVSSRANIYKRGGRDTFGGIVVLSGIEGYRAYKKGEHSAIGKSGLDLLMGGLGTFGGPPGLAIGTFYFLLDILGVFEPYVPTNPPQPFGVPDRTYVAAKQPILKQ